MLLQKPKNAAYGVNSLIRPVWGVFQSKSYSLYNVQLSVVSVSLMTNVNKGFTLQTLVYIYRCSTYNIW